jgi:hypothetical protein
MRLIKSLLAGAAIVGGVTAGALGTANAEPPPPPGYPAGDVPPPGAPAKPPQPKWSPNTPVVWEQLGYRWGVWINGSFLPIY